MKILELAKQLNTTSAFLLRVLKSLKLKSVDEEQVLNAVVLSVLKSELKKIGQLPEPKRQEDIVKKEPEVKEEVVKKKKVSKKSEKDDEPKKKKVAAKKTVKKTVKKEESEVKEVKEVKETVDKKVADKPLEDKKEV